MKGKKIALGLCVTLLALEIIFVHKYGDIDFYSESDMSADEDVSFDIDYEEDTLVSSTNKPKQLGETTYFYYVDGQDVGIAYIDVLGFCSDEIVKKIVNENGLEVDDNSHYVGVSYVSTIDPREDYIDIKVYSCGGENIVDDGVIYPSKVYDYYDEVICEDGWYQSIYGVYKIPKNIDNYLLKIGYSEVEDFYDYETITANYLISSGK